MLQVDLPDIRFLETVYSRGSDPSGDDPSDEDLHHAYLVLSTRDATMVG